MAILEEDIARVRQASDLVEVMTAHIALKKVGRRWTGLCPFHAEKSPSFSVNAEEGLYYCFGCQAKGDAISFVQAVEHVPFVEAVEKLAARAGIELRYDSAAVTVDRKQRDELRQAMERAVEWYHDRLLRAPDARVARAYLRDRGYDGDVVRQFKLGWAPDAWDELARALKLPDHVLKDSGLGFVNQRGRRQDAFRGRVLFPIFDPSGAPVAFGGRVLPGGEGPKYKNSSETRLYAKSRTLYALNWAKTDVVTKSQVIVCEGYTDVIAFFQAGVPRAVATCGTALTEDHVRLLKSFAPRVVLAYDADGAGQAAAERFYEWERKFDIQIWVAAFAVGSDPADVVRRDPKLLETAVHEAKPYLEFRLERFLRATDLQTIEGRARAARRCVAMVAEHPDAGVRHQYLQLVEGWTKVPVDQLQQFMADGASELVDLRDTQPVRAKPSRSEEGAFRAEWEALRVAVHRPEEVAALLDQIVPPDAPDGIEEILFLDSRARAAFRALTEAPTLSAAVGGAQPEASELLARLAVEEEGEDAECFVRLIDRAATRAIRELEVEARVGVDGFTRVGPSIAWLKLTVERLRDPPESIDAAAAIVAWLLERAASSDVAGPFASSSDRSDPIEHRP